MIRNKIKLRKSINENFEDDNPLKFIDQSEIVISVLFALVEHMHDLKKEYDNISYIRSSFDIVSFGDDYTPDISFNSKSDAIKDLIKEYFYEFNDKITDENIIKFLPEFLKTQMYKEKLKIDAEGDYYIGYIEVPLFEEAEFEINFDYDADLVSSKSNRKSMSLSLGSLVGNLTNINLDEFSTIFQVFIDTYRKGWYLGGYKKGQLSSNRTTLIIFYNALKDLMNYHQGDEDSASIILDLNSYFRNDPLISDLYVVNHEEMCRDFRHYFLSGNFVVSDTNDMWEHDDI